jgi:hypothetical protein
MESDTKYYDEEGPEEESQKYPEKETELEKLTTFPWHDFTLFLENKIAWGKLSGISATLIRRSNGTCYVNFSVNITSHGHRTDNNPD